MSLFTVAQEDFVYPLPHLDDPRMLGDPSTSIDLQYIPEPPSSIPFQSNQLVAEPAGPIQAQETRLPEEVLLQLAEVEWQHEAARYQILEKAQAVPTNTHVGEATAGYSYAVTDEAATGLAGVYDTSSVPAYPPQIPNHGFISSDSSSPYGFDVHSWPGQQLTPTVIYPNTPHDHIQGFGPQGNTFSDAQDLHYNAVGDAGYGQRPPIDPMALATSHYNTGPSLLSTCNLGSNTSSLMTLTRYHHPQSSLPLQAVGPVPVPANQLPAYMANDIEHGTIGHLAASPLWNEDLTLPAARSFTTAMHELPPVAETSFDATETLDMTGATGLLVPTRAIRGKPKYGKRTQTVAASPYHRKTRPGREMENVSFYKDPEAYSQQQKDQPKVYSQRTDKSESSCFGCRRSKRKVCGFFRNFMFDTLLTLFEVHDFDRRHLPPMPDDLEDVFGSYSASKVYVQRPNEILGDVNLHRHTTRHRGI
ncbi:hypothetical protein J4E80_010832 [Alternaria sp. BMP 0032]|nr:hypothetical protein J4E80_010832 [Alternaria sp. BMP 0032]